MVQPRRTTVIERVGTEKSGILEIERRGYLTTGEMAFVQQQTTSDDSTEKLLDLVQKVSKKFKIDTEKAYKYVTAAATGSDDEGAVVRKIKDAYAQELNEIVQALMGSANRKKIVAAFCMILYRVDEDYTLEEFMELDPELVDGIYNLFLQEESRVNVDLELDAKEEEEKEGPAGASQVEQLAKK